MNEDEVHDRDQQPASSVGTAAGPTSPSTLAELQATVGLVRQGRGELLGQLRQQLREHPEVWRGYGDLAKQVQHSWVDLISHDDLLVRESLWRYVGELQRDLAGPDASPLERLQAERIAIDWLRLMFHDRQDATRPEGEDLRLAQFQLRRQVEAHRQFTTSITALAAIRRLTTPRTRVMIVRESPNEEDRDADGSRNGKRPANGKPKKTRGQPVGAGHAGVNGERMNGHNRLAGLLGPVTGGEGG